LQLIPSLPVGAVEESVLNEDAYEKIYMDAYNKISYPQKSDLRYSSLMQDCKQVIAVAQDNPHLYRKFKIILSQFMAGSNEHDQCHGSRDQSQKEDHSSAVVRAPIPKGQK
jgi:hypothetical protein